MQHPIITHINEAIELAEYELQQYKDLQHEKEMEQAWDHSTDLQLSIDWLLDQSRGTQELIDALKVARNNANF